MCKKIHSEKVKAIKIYADAHDMYKHEMSSISDYNHTDDFNSESFKNQMAKQVALDKKFGKAMRKFDKHVLHIHSATMKIKDKDAHVKSLLKYDEYDKYEKDFLVGANKTGVYSP